MREFKKPDVVMALTLNINNPWSRIVIKSAVVNDSPLYSVRKSQLDYEFGEKFLAAETEEEKEEIRQEAIEKIHCLLNHKGENRRKYVIARTALIFYDEATTSRFLDWFEEWEKEFGRETALVAKSPYFKFEKYRVNVSIMLTTEEYKQFIEDFPWQAYVRVYKEWLPSEGPEIEWDGDYMDERYMLWDSSKPEFEPEKVVPMVEEKYEWYEKPDLALPDGYDPRGLKFSKQVTNLEATYYNAVKQEKKEDLLELLKTSLKRKKAANEINELISKNYDNYLSSDGDLLSDLNKLEPKPSKKTVEKVIELFKEFNES